MACQTTELPPRTAPGATAPIDTHEEMLRKQAQEEFQKIKASGRLLDNSSIRNYIRSIAKNVLPEPVWESVPYQFYVLKSPTPNAFAFPNGIIVIHTGLIARLQNEAQLALILAHEAIHVEYRHMREHLANLENKTAGLRALSIAAAPFGRLGRLGYTLGKLGTIAAVTGFGRDLERESDKKGFNYLLKSPYSMHEAPKVFELLNLQLDKERDPPPYLYASHPRNSERKAYLRRLVRTHNSGEYRKRTFRNRYVRTMKSVKQWNARQNIERYWPRTARFELKQLMDRYPHDPEFRLLQAQTYLHESPADYDRAFRILKELEEAKYKNREFLVQYGRVLKQVGELKKAASVYKTLLNRYPNAPRREMILYTLSTIENAKADPK